MTVHLQTRTDRWGTFDDVDLAEAGLGDLKIERAYSHAARATWTLVAAHHTRPIERLTFVKIWDDALTDNAGNPQSESNPWFVGYVEEVDPADDPLEVRYTAYDPTFRAAKETFVFSGPFLPGEIPDVPPLRSVGAIPRLVLNVKIDADDDWAFQISQDLTWSQIVAGLLEFCYQALYWIDAAPGDGSNDGNDVPYLFEDLFADDCEGTSTTLPDLLTSTTTTTTDDGTTTASSSSSSTTTTTTSTSTTSAESLACSDFRPQEKLVFESETIRSAVDRMQRYEPRRRVLFEPSSRRWRFHDIVRAPAETVTLNDPNTAHPVLSMQLRASTDHCCSAVHIFGPPTTEIWEFIWYADGTIPTGANVGQLWPIGDATVIQSYSDVSGMQEEKTWNRWRVAEPAFRRGARALPVWYQARVGEYQWMPVKMPVLLISFDGGNDWIAAQNVWFDNLLGLATFNGTVPYLKKTDAAGNSITPGSTQTAFAPDAVKLIWAPYVETISVREPPDGHEGDWTAATGKVLELCQYDESLAVGFEFGNPVTTATRRAQFAKYARSILDWRKDIAWSGSIVLDGIDTRFDGLNRRLQFAAKNGNGETITSGWETISAFVTDVEYDTEEQLTTVTFSSDRLELLGEDPAQLKERLKIKALEQRTRYQQTLHFRTEQNYRGEAYQILSGLTVLEDFYYVDPDTQEESL